MDVVIEVRERFYGPIEESKAKELLYQHGWTQYNSTLWQPPNVATQPSATILPFDHQKTELTELLPWLEL